MGTISNCLPEVKCARHRDKPEQASSDPASCVYPSLCFIIALLLTTWQLPLGVVSFNIKSCEGCMQRNARLSGLLHPSQQVLGSLGRQQVTGGKSTRKNRPKIKNHLNICLNNDRWFPDSCRTEEGRKRRAFFEKNRVNGFSKERQRGGKKWGGGQNLTRRPPTKNSFQPPHLGTFPPLPYPIFLSKSLRNSLNFPQLTSSETIFGGSRKAVSDGPSSRGFPFRYVLPPPLALPSFFLGGWGVSGFWVCLWASRKSTHTSGDVRPRQATEISAISEEFLHWIFSSFSSAKLNFPPFQEGNVENMAPFPGRDMCIKSCHVSGCHGFSAMYDTVTVAAVSVTTES